MQISFGFGWIQITYYSTILLIIQALRRTLSILMTSVIAFQSRLEHHAIAVKLSLIGNILRPPIFVITRQRRIYCMTIPGARRRDKIVCGSFMVREARP